MFRNKDLRATTVRLDVSLLTEGGIRFVEHFSRTKLLCAF
jgi:hypothetical protein